MKVPPKRKGNRVGKQPLDSAHLALNESPSEKEGKYPGHFCHVRTRHPSMKVPPKRKGNNSECNDGDDMDQPSMKVPPKRKGNAEPS